MVPRETGSEAEDADAADQRGNIGHIGVAVPEEGAESARKTDE